VHTCTGTLLSTTAVLKWLVPNVGARGTRSGSGKGSSPVTVPERSGGGGRGGPTASRESVEGSDKSGGKDGAPFGESNYQNRHQQVSRVRITHDTTESGVEASDNSSNNNGSGEEPADAGAAEATAVRQDSRMKGPLEADANARGGPITLGYNIYDSWQADGGASGIGADGRGTDAEVEDAEVNFRAVHAAARRLRIVEAVGVVARGSGGGGGRDSTVLPTDPWFTQVAQQLEWRRFINWESMARCAKQRAAERLLEPPPPLPPPSSAPPPPSPASPSASPSHATAASAASPSASARAAVAKHGAGSGDGGASGSLDAAPAGGAGPAEGPTAGGRTGPSDITAPHVRPTVTAPKAVPAGAARFASAVPGRNTGSIGGDDGHAPRVDTAEVHPRRSAEGKVMVDTAEAAAIAALLGGNETALLVSYHASALTGHTLRPTVASEANGGVVNG
jgi:hypothetical protein